MKSLYLLGACALLSTTLFSCTADEFDTTSKKTEIQKDVVRDSIQASEPDGPGDDPINLPPPKK
ncbi:hypothetical protein DBB36_15635 [Flavobacterium sp. WLB]|uniref:Secreted protein n=1 Tax=Flavobacterium panici TaxID=2654843 RepID=A0A9N8P2A2_9FLAO|nr:MULTISPECIES: hypothetical protein [Flavobacterium]KOP36392.1 hypothetical protein AKO67_21135 [Flavobacterium sp. VMW]OWU90332.1 hypothetical protein APR43_12280 [Flavobacterium sp. NLM]PUU69047.1 hypothetical protein DBB36_15635 [Flavobacterium sp. WLB]CAC9974880.1 hypothetical protein FLAPXU55_02577 [Flavobacterium panici]